MQEINVFVVDDHQIFLDGIVSLLDDEPNVKIAGTASSGKQAVERIKNSKVDVVLMDINMPEMDGIEATKLLRKTNPDIKILMLTMHSEPRFIKECLEIGAKGYVLKNISKDDLLKAIETVYQDKSYLDQDVQEKLISSISNADEEDILECNSDDLSSLKNVTAQTDIIVTTVGPFALYGENLVDACVQTSTHYCDITGEPAFVKSVLQKHNAAAREKGIYIINCCGFDSIPADAGAYFTAMQLPANETKTVKGFVSSSGTFSGGTFASAVNAMSDIGKDMVAGKKKSGEVSTKQKRRIESKIYFDKALKKWAVPMPVIDPWMVMRSSSLRKEVYGENFEYAQFLALSSLPQVAAIVGTVGAMVAGAQIPPLKNLMLKYRKSGEGPSKEKRDKSYFKVVFLGESETKKVRTKVSGGDPGYTETSKMLSETALILLDNLGKLPVKGGVLTPAGTLGNLLIEKLQSKGINFEVLEEL